MCVCTPCLFVHVHTPCVVVTLANYNSQSLENIHSIHLQIHKQHLHAYVDIKEIQGRLTTAPGLKILYKSYLSQSS